MIETKEDFLKYFHNYKKIDFIDLDHNTLFNNDLLEDPELGGIFFAYYPNLFTSYLSTRKYKKDYFTSIYESMIKLSDIRAIDEIYRWTYEVIDAEGDGNHYFNEINYIIELFEKNLEIIYLANEEILFNQDFLEKAKDILYQEFLGRNHLFDIEERLFNAIKSFKRAEDLTNSLNGNSKNNERKRAKL